MSAGFALLQRFLRESSGLALEDEKRYLLEDRLRTILQDANLGRLDDLAQRLYADRHSELAQRVIEAATINETSFFRDRALFSAFSQTLLPDLIEARRTPRRLRIWCAGCSTGQEPYSIAMLIDDAMRLLGGWQVEILASDLSRPVVEAARRGCYSQFEVQRGLPVAMLLRHFNRTSETWQVSDYLRAKVTFKVQNLLTLPRDLGRFDVIFCRNVLFYFDQATKRNVLGSLTRALEPDGFLVLGGGERIGECGTTLSPDERMPFVFRDRPPSADRLQTLRQSQPA